MTKRLLTLLLSIALSLASTARAQTPHDTVVVSPWVGWCGRIADSLTAPTGRLQLYALDSLGVRVPGVRWRSTNPYAVPVGVTSGLIRARRPGRARIIATAPDGRRDTLFRAQAVTSKALCTGIGARSTALNYAAPRALRVTP
jgi:hypothetical protein